ncbi:hypothetical protein LJB42_004623 [Komagataella kurtzmanii]|nr:hypothetical protein LJB42_004623 [Komagataella kurtzmanii]
MARQNFIGLVVSQGKMDKTVKVRVEQMAYNTKIHKSLFKRKNYLVHDEGNICKEGDIVRIEATRPLSSRKHFAVAEIKKNKGQQFAKYEEEATLKIQKEEREKTNSFLQRREDKINQKSSIVQDLKDIEKLCHGSSELTAEEVTRITQLKEKYGVTTWPPNKPIVDLDIRYLAQKITDLRVKISRDDKLVALFDGTKANEEKINRILAKLNKDPTSKRSIKKNLVRKFLNDSSIEDKTEVGL